MKYSELIFYIICSLHSANCFCRKKINDMYIFIFMQANKHSRYVTIFGVGIIPLAAHSNKNLWRGFIRNFLAHYEKNVNSHTYVYTGWNLRNWYTRWNRKDFTKSLHSWTIITARNVTETPEDVSCSNGMIFN